MNSRQTLYGIGGILLLLTGAGGLWRYGLVVSDSSFMQTLRVLGEPGVTTQLWIRFYISLTIIFSSVILLKAAWKSRVIQ